MEVNAQKLKQLRTDKAWTQQHLADACGISLRTVQRVERYGNASKETLMAFAAVFEIEQSEILAHAQEVISVKQMVEVDKKLERSLLIKAVSFGIAIGITLTLVVTALVSSG